METASLLGTDNAGSVITALGSMNGMLAYTPYGYLVPVRHTGWLGYVGQWQDHCVQGYQLGNGRRLYRPALMRFVSPDSMSPFLRGGLNAYAYCEGDPMNYIDASGQAKTGLTALLKNNALLGFKKGIKKYFKDRSEGAMRIETDKAYIVKRKDGQYTVEPSETFAEMQGHLNSSQADVKKLEDQLKRAKGWGGPPSAGGQVQGTSHNAPPRPPKPSQNNAQWVDFPPELPSRHLASSDSSRAGDYQAIWPSGEMLKTRSKK